VKIKKVIEYEFDDADLYTAVVAIESLSRDPRSDPKRLVDQVLTAFPRVECTKGSLFAAEEAVRYSPRYSNGQYVPTLVAKKVFKCVYRFEVMDDQ
jgi:hypothetical protein